jgi:hypothetical protein
MITGLLGLSKGLLSAEHGVPVLLLAHEGRRGAQRLRALAALPL